MTRPRPATATPREPRSARDRRGGGREGSARRPTLLSAAAGALALAVALALAGHAGAQATAPGPVTVPGGSYDPFYPVKGEAPHQVAPFVLDATPVTNAEFLAFVADDPFYQRGALPPVFAAPGYLRHWAGPTELGAADPDAPVVNVSWFAASAYCEARDMRLPTEAEWELVGRASEDRLDARGDPLWAVAVLARTTANGPLPAVGRDAPNAYGVHDMHRLFEWVDDAGSSITTHDSRGDGDDRIATVCGGAAEGASDRSDYAAFLRFAVRAGTSASSVTPHLGFRCAGVP
jgi:formylglycine-generating enzyme